MKKRSLIASIAMLLVSAIVLTSSTYAWFATGTTAKVSNIEASIVNDDGTLVLSAWHDGQFKPTLNKIDFYTHPAYPDDDVSPNSFIADVFYPTSLVFYDSFVDSAWDCVTGKITQDLSSDSSNYGEMIFETYDWSDVYNVDWPLTFLVFYAKATKDCTVEVRPSFGTTNISYAYAYIRSARCILGGYGEVDEVEWIHEGFYSPMEGRSYYPLVYNAPSGIDSNNNGIMDFEDKALNNIDPYAGVSTEKIVATNKPFQMEFKANELYGFEVVIWAEGQDPACVGPISDGFIQFGIDFEVI